MLMLMLHLLSAHLLSGWWMLLAHVGFAAVALCRLHVASLY